MTSSHTFSDVISFLNSSSYILAMMLGETFSYKTRETHFLNEHTVNKANKCIIIIIQIINTYLQTSSDDFIIDVSDDHSMDDSDPKQSGQNPLQDIKPDV